MNKLHTIEENNEHSLSSLQTGMLFHTEFSDEKSIYVTQAKIHLEEAIHADHLRKALVKLSIYYPILLSYIAPLTLTQKIASDCELVLQETDFSLYNNELKQEYFANFLEYDLEQKFDFTKPPLIRFHLIKFSEEEFYFIITYHHALFAGTCVLKIITDLFAIYDSLCKNTLENIVPLNYDNSFWGVIDHEKLSTARHLLNKSFANIKAIAELPTQKIITKKSSDFVTETFLVDKVLSNSISIFCKKSAITRNLFLQIAWALVLKHYATADDIVFGATREFSPALTKGKIGFFINTVPVYLHIDPDMPIGQCFKELKEQHKLFADAVYISLNDYNFPRKTFSNPNIFETIFDYKPISPNNFVKKSYKDWGNNRHLEYTYITNYPIAIELQEAEGEIIGRCVYATKYFQQSFIAKLITSFKNVIETLLISEQSSSVQKLLDPLREKDHCFTPAYLYKAGDVNLDINIVSLLQQRTLAYPEKTAVVCQNNSLTYAELNKQSSSLADQLYQNYKLSCPQRVIVVMDKNENYVVAILSLIKLGVTFIPIDRSAPAVRNIKIITDSEAKFLIASVTDKKLLKTLSFKGRIIYFEDEVQNDSSTAIDNYRYSNDLHEIAYILYTSGSTGMPKGVKITHRSLLNVILSFQKTVSFTEQDTLLSVTTHIFDIAYLELLLPLVSGGTCVIAAETEKKSIGSIVKLLERHQPTYMQATPTFWLSLVNHLEKSSSYIKTILVGGELLTLSLAGKLKKLATHVWNLYGPTETTIWSTAHEVTPHDLEHNVIPIGVPIDNTSVYIVNDKYQTVSLNEVGEICIGGAGLAEGYTDSLLTQSSFITLDGDAEMGNRVFKTGDLGYLNEEKNLVFSGREDTLVKIQGHRVELSEVEAALKNSPNVMNAVIKTFENKRQSYLVAYYQAKKKIAPENLVEFMSKTLPDYMIPKIYVHVKKFPLTDNGKIDVKKLAKPTTFLSKCHSALQSAELEMVRVIWSEILNVEVSSIYPSTNFFELGGNSIEAMQIISRINELFNIDLRIREIFNHPTLLELSNKILNLTKNQMPLTVIPIRTVECEEYPLSYQQKRLWIFEQINGSSPTYNMFVAFKITGELSIAALESSLLDIIDKHSILRTTYHVRDGHPYQVVLAEYYFAIEKQVIQNLSQNDIENIVHNYANESFDLTKDLAIKAKLLTQDDNTAYFLVNIHHIACDGWSMKILAKDLHAFYRAHLDNLSIAFPSISINYKDYAFWQSQIAYDKSIEYIFDDWRENFTNVSNLNLLYDKIPADKKTIFNGESISFKIEKNTLTQIHALLKRHNMTLFMFLMTAFATMLYRITRQSSFMMGFPCSGRHTSDLEDVLGFFVNLLPIRFDCADDKSFLTLLAEARARTLHAINYQDVPFELILNKIQKIDNQLYNVFNVLFIMQENFDIQPRLGNASIERVFSTNESLLMANYNSSKNDLSLYMQEKNDELVGLFEYRTDLFYEATIHNFIAYFKEILQALVVNIDQPLGSIRFISPNKIQPYDSELVRVNTTSTHFYSILDKYKDMVAAYPNHVAISADNLSLTYQELDQKSNQLAQILLQKTNGCQLIIAIYLERSIDFVISIISTLKIGCAYLPLDTLNPQERIEYILEDSQAELLISDTALLKDTDINFEKTSLTDVVAIDAIVNELQQTSIDRVHYNHSDLDIAYIIYTSGSTGKPKGVVVTHGNIAHLFQSTDQLYSWTNDEKWSLLHSMGFDFSVWEMWGALLHGNEIVVVPNDTIESVKNIIELLVNKKITVLNITPSYLNVLQTHLMNEPRFNQSQFFKHLKTIILGGESIVNLNLMKWFEMPDAIKAKLINMYGITEGTVHFSYFEITKENAVETYTRNIIGRPIPGCEILLLDNGLKPVPTGIIGEMYLTGKNVSYGYLNNDELTAQRFLKVPLNDDHKSISMYKTGDLAKINKDGNIEYISREDTQVSLRGYRIELNEIKQCILQVSGINDAVVITNGLNAQQEICAFLVPKRFDIQLFKAEPIDHERVLNWQTVFNHIYGANSIYPDEFNISGWHDSYSGKNISIDHMKDWVDQTAKKILELNPKHVLEIGCGTGLILFPLLSHIDSYTGLDGSLQSISYIQSILQKKAINKAIHLFNKTAKDIKNLEIKFYDTVIINSVIQYFPSADYLIDALDQAIEHITSNGHLFIGDVRDLQLADLYYMSLSNSSENALSKLQFESFKNHEEELLTAVDFFYDYAKHHPRVNYLRIEIKHSEFINEMSRFRCDVVFGIDKPLNPNQEPLQWQDWKAISLMIIEKDIQSFTFDYIAIKNVPNKRTFDLSNTFKLLSHVKLSKVDKDHLNHSNQIDPYIIMELADKYQLNIHLLLCKEDPQKLFDFILYKDSAKDKVESSFTFSKTNTCHDGSIMPVNKAHFNQPLISQYNQSVVNAAKQKIKSQLPAYMQLSRWYVINSIPMTNNNKIDHRALRGLLKQPHPTTNALSTFEKTIAMLLYERSYSSCYVNKTAGLSYKCMN